MPQTNHGSIEFIKFPDPNYPGDNTKLIKKWLRDSWARRKIINIQNTITTCLINTGSGNGTINTQYATEAALSYMRYGVFVAIPFGLHLKNISAYSDTVIGTGFPASKGTSFCVSNLMRNDGSVQAYAQVDTSGHLRLITRAFSIGSSATTIIGQLMYIANV